MQHALGTASWLVSLFSLHKHNLPVSGDKVQLEFPVTKTTECSKAGKTAYIFSLSSDAFMIVFENTQGK